LKQHNKQSWDFDKTKNALEAAEQMDRAETLGGLSEILARASAEISHATYSRVYLLGENGRSITLAAEHVVRAMSAPAEPGSVHRLDNSPLIRRVLESGKSLEVGENNPEFAPNEWESRFILTGQTRAAMITPILVGEQPMGVVITGEERCSEREPLTEEKKRLIRLLARHAGMAIENMNLVAALREEKRLAELIIENTPALIFLTDKNGKIETANRTSETATGRSRSEMEGGNIFDLLFAPETSVKIKELIARNVENGFPVSFQEDYRIKGGRFRVAQWNCAPLWEDDTGRFKVLIMGVDVTDSVTSRRKLEESHRNVVKAHWELQETLDRLQNAQSVLVRQEKMAAIGQLAAGMAHEINNPNSFVISNLFALKEYTEDILKAYDYLRNLLTKYLPPDEIEKVQQMEADLGIGTILEDYQDTVIEAQEGAQRISAIVKELQFFAGEGKKEDLIDLGEIIDATLKVVKNQLKFKTSVETDFSPSPLIRGNWAELGQAILNVLINAADFLDEENLNENRLKISMREHDEHILVEFEDNGPGIKPESLEHIFQPFYTTKPVGKGTGLGLTVAYEIVKKHGGDMWAESRPGEWTRIIMQFPKATGNLPVGSKEHARRELLQEIPGPAPETEVKMPHPAKPAAGDLPRILLVDDEVYLLKSYMRRLHDMYEITASDSGKEALDLLTKDENFDAVICDLLMPDLPGYRLYTEAVKRNPSLADKFIFVTGGAFSGDAGKFMDNTDLPVLQKPFPLDELIETIDKVLKSK